MSDSETLDESSSSSSPIASIEPNESQSSPNRETLIVASPISFEEEEALYGSIPITSETQILPVTQSDSCSDLPDDPWKLNPSPSYDSYGTDDYDYDYDDDDDEDDEDDDELECSKPLLSYCNREQFEKKEEKEIRHLSYTPPTGVGIGIWNKGNSCFLNSVLQCLTHTVPFVQSLRAYRHQFPCNCGRQLCVMSMIRNHINVALLPYMTPISPLCFLNNLHYFSPDFRRGQQEDAQEFLQEFLDKLERCCLDRTDPSRDVNVVENVFGGRLISTLRCCNCGSDSKTYEPSVGMSLEIGDVDDLRDALESFTRLEELDEKLTCDNCNEKVSKEKKLSLDKIPVVAMFHLKRFKNNGYYMEKIFKQVKFQLELDLYPYMMSNDENEGNTKYHLYAFVEHLGTLGYGHYCAYVRSAPKTWHKFDDEKVIRIEEENVLTKNAYMLFYVKEGTPWFSRAFEEMHSLRGEYDDDEFWPESLLDPTNGECVSEISYEKGSELAVVSTNNSCVKTEENSVSVSKESNEEDMSLSASKSSSNDEDYSPMEREPLDMSDDSCSEVVPLLVVQDQVSSTKQQEEILPSEIEHMETEKSQEESMTSDVEESKETETAPRDLVTKQQEETLQSEIEKSQQGSCEQLMTSDVEDTKETETTERDMVTKAPPRSRELVQATSETGSPPKKFKAV